MRKTAFILIFILITAVFTACGKSTEDVPGNGVVAGGLAIRVGDDINRVKEVFGEPVGYSESLSCLYDGFDKSFVYDGMEIITYPDNNSDFISSIMISSDTIATPDGFGPGKSIDDVIDAYASEDLLINDYCVILEKEKYGICHYYDKATRKIDKTEIYLIDQ